MNARLIELAEQAGITTNLDTDYFERDMNKWVDYYSEKFAELIVQECKDIAFRRGDNVDYLSLQLINNEVDDAKDALRAYELGEQMREFDKFGTKINMSITKRDWIGLTDDEIFAIGKELGLKCRLGGNPNIDIDYAKAIEAKLKEKNT